MLLGAHGEHTECRENFKQCKRSIDHILQTPIQALPLRSHHGSSVWVVPITPPPFPVPTAQHLITPLPF